MDYFVESPVLVRARDALRMIAEGSTATPKDWDEVLKFVRTGFGPKMFPVGTQLNVSRGEGVDPYVFDVVDHRTVTDPATSTQKPGMVLMLHHAIASKQFDAPEAMYYASEALAAGTYHFKTSDTSETTYQFTLTQQVPKGGQIFCDYPDGQTVLTSRTMKTYSSAASTTVIESAAISEGSEGIDLGICGNASYPNMNNFSRCRYGSNNYKESAARQWINSAAAANAWWAASNKFDRPASYVSTAGFLNNLDSSFVAAVRALDVPCKTNNTFELPGWTKNTAYTVRDKFFLASRNEVGFGTENVAEGTVFSYYNGATNADRIKRSTDGTARYWWLRSPHPSNAGYVRYVLTDGSLDGYHASITGYAVAPACVIA